MRGQVSGFSQADPADQELEAEEVLDGRPVDLRQSGEVELLEGLEYREAGLLGSWLTDAVLAQSPIDTRKASRFQWTLPACCGMMYDDRGSRGVTCFKPGSSI